MKWIWISSGCLVMSLICRSLIWAHKIFYIPCWFAVPIFGVAAVVTGVFAIRRSPAPISKGIAVLVTMMSLIYSSIMIFGMLTFRAD